MAVTEITMDHLAVASHRAWDNLIRYGYDLGGKWLGGPDNDPNTERELLFYFCQVEFDGGTKIEILEALPNETSDFIRRFLDRNGPGPHHYTFKVPDFEAATKAVADAGYDLVGINTDDPSWNEAFLHPKQSHGIVIQLACQGEGNDGWIDATQLPPSGRSLPTLTRLVHLVADLDAAVALFSGVLNMTIANKGTDNDGRFVSLSSGPWTLRLVEPTDDVLRHWLGSRAGRLHHAAFAMDEAGNVPDARPLGDGRYEVPPEDNLGLRLILETN
jgi:methylmalonyl-CoA/ethylmalonyl-CoA epimerase